MRYFTASVADNEDPDQLGRLSLVIPELSGPDEPYPDWILPRVAPGTGENAGWFFVPTVNSIVVVELSEGGVVRWTGGSWGAVNTVPSFLAGNYPHRSGFTSPAGAHTVALDDDVGLLLLVSDAADPDGPANYLSLDSSAGQAKIGLANGSLLMIGEKQAVLMTSGGATLCLDEDNGILLTHQGGGHFLSLTDAVAMLSGADIKLVGPVTLTADPTGLTPTEPMVLGTSFLTDFLTFLNGCIGDAAMSPGVAAAATVLAATVTTALAAGAPYLSTSSSTS